MKFVRLAAAAGAGVIALGLVSCSSTGGKPAGSGDGWAWRRHASTPRA